MTDAERHLAIGRPLWLADRISVDLDWNTGWYALTTFDLAGKWRSREYFATFEALREQHGARMAEAMRKVGSDA